jgi:hypothetical protein
VSAASGDGSEVRRLDINKTTSTGKFNGGAIKGCGADQSDEIALPIIKEYLEQLIPVSKRTES